MSLAINTVADQLAQLDTARNVVLGDAALYPQIVQGVLPIIGANAHLQLRRWGAEFLAETFASPALPREPKQKLASVVIGTLNDLISNPNEDHLVVKFVVQTAASIYPYIFRTVVDEPSEEKLWESMTTIKQSILSRWNQAPLDVKVCCIKFAQKVVQVQTTGPIADPRRPEHNETSLAIVPRTHPVLQLPSLEAEASGLLDRLLNSFYENSSDPILVNATLNCLAALIRSRHSVGSKIINAILNYNPIAAAMSSGVPITPKLKVNMKSIERTTRALLLNIIKRAPGHPMTSKIHHYIEKLALSRIEMLQEPPRKRAAPTEPTDVVDSAKRARLGLEIPQALKIPPMPPGPNTVQQLFTLTEDQALANFDVKQLPIDLLVKITVPLLAKVNQGVMDQAINAIRSRYEMLSKRQVFDSLKGNQPQPAEDEDDAYEPEYEPVDVPFEPAPPPGMAQPEPEDEGTDLALGPFVLPQPDPLSENQATDLGKDTVQRIFSLLSTLEQPQKQIGGPAPSSTQQKSGFSRLAASSLDRDSWLTLLTRLATRGTVEGEGDVEPQRRNKESVADSIRNLLYRFVLEQFRGRINVAISWMNEEWYNDKIRQKAYDEEKARREADGDTTELTLPAPKRHYDIWVVKMMEGFMPYLDSRDNKVLIRFLSETPELTQPLIEKVKTLANDPERVNLCVQAFHYLVLFRPPSRNACLDALESLYQTVPEARPLITKILAKWRPAALPQQDQGRQQQPPAAAPTAGSPPGAAAATPAEASAS